MSFSTINMPSTNSIFLVDARQGPNKILLLPDAGTVPGRFVCIKDYYGMSGSSSFYISTTVGNLIDIYTSTIQISTSFQSMSFMSDGNNWALLANQTGPVPVSFSPTYISTPEIWFDASYLPSISTDTTNYNVLSWSNRGSINVSADSNGVFNSPPRVFQDTQNGLNVVTYNTSNGLRINSMSLLSAYSGRTCFAVYKQLELFSPSSTRTIPFLLANELAFYNDFAFFVGQSNAQVYAAINNNLVCFPVQGLYDETADSYNMLSLVATITSNQGPGVWVNGFNVNSNFGCQSFSWPADYFYDVGGSTGCNICLNYNNAESLIFSYIMPTADRQKIEGYLAWKWGLRNLLPGNHPYKNTAP